MNSAISRFYRLSMSERRERVASLVGLSEAEAHRLSPDGGLGELQADRMIENAVGVFGLPLGVCVNLRLNEQDVLVPMVVEEPSVVAACSYACKLLRAGGGVTAECSDPIVVGQIQVLEVPDAEAAERAIMGATDELLALADSGHPRLLKAGGGARGIEVRHLPRADADDPCGDMLVVHLLVDVRDAMGANAINSMCERLAPRVADLTGGRVGLRILSNLTDRRTVTVTGRVPFEALDGKGTVGGEELAKRIEEASVFAERDPYRACTHNKGIMNGVDAVLIALGQDWRAVEAGAHAHASSGGRYTAMARWRVEDGHLVGRMTIPLAVGTVGGVAKTHPVVEANRQIARVEDAAHLAGICASIGLAQNLGAIRALAAEGIQRGHMRLHARNVAVEAGAEEHEVLEVAQRIADAGQVNAREAGRVIAELRGAGSTPLPLAGGAGGGTARANEPTTPLPLAGGAGGGAAPANGASAAAHGPARASAEADPGSPPNPGHEMAADSVASRRPYTPPTKVMAPFGPALGEGAPSATEDPMGDEKNADRDFGGKVLVTGAAGHLGANLVRRLLDEGRDVRVLLRQGSDNRAVDGLDVERVYGDLRDPASLGPAVKGAETIYHAAARVSTVQPTPEIEREVYECNVLGTKYLLRAAMDHGVERVVVTGSFSAVGYDLDDMEAPGHEDMPHWPFEELLPYARTKVLVEHEALKAAVEGLDVLIATSCAILGPNDYKPSRMGKTLIDFSHGNMPAYIPGGFDFVSARDLCEGHVLAMRRGRTGQKYIISTQYLEVDELMAIFEEVSGHPRPRMRLPGAVMAPVAEVSSFVLGNFFPKAPQRLTPAAVRILRKRRRADTTKAQRELGYQPTSIRHAIHEAYADFARRGLVPARPGTTAPPIAHEKKSEPATPAQTRATGS